MNDMSLKARIKNFSVENSISAQAVLQYYLMGRFLYRLSMTDYREKFVLKGGMLISSIIGVEHRTTMDLDTTLLNLPMNEDSISKAFLLICSIQLDDGILFEFDSISPIREDDMYGGYRASFTAIFGKIKAPMSMDVSTGDIITPGAVRHVFHDMFDDSIGFELWTYSIETILAEKIETILSRGTDNTRPRDFYDVYMLSCFDYDVNVFKEAFKATAIHRGSFEKIRDISVIIKEILESPEMNRHWESYVRQASYASDIKFADTVSRIKKVLSIIC